MPAVKSSKWTTSNTTACRLGGVTSRRQPRRGPQGLHPDVVLASFSHECVQPPVVFARSVYWSSVFADGMYLKWLGIVSVGGLGSKGTLRALLRRGEVAQLRAIRSKVAVKVSMASALVPDTVILTMGTLRGISTLRQLHGGVAGLFYKPRVWK
ncbi:hypothetical protein P691DRAFT_789799 [Macrolepiota fuliginosa MF-IS2]|uniref:Uncharacterized protein n=1 Tax=Macrolepiota fuliginosa MF-IS2 TaxID=1400762 RepID=A0A9P5X2Q6_9AGAR|nr:hypothetical protein P691DRAFT_789799 [Macrolepiota fuliginosa MF-IS2]